MARLLFTLARIGMFDFVKMVINDKKLQENLLANPLLNFYSEISQQTGEILNDKQTANFLDFKFVIFPTGRTEIKGSLHKLYNGLFGCSFNHDIFTYKKVEYIIRFLKEKFSLDPDKAVLHNIEFGFNVSPDINVNDIIDAAVVYKQKTLNRIMDRNRMRTGGVDCYLTEYGIKLYNKSLQYNINGNILRYEKKTYRMRNSFGKFKLSLTCLLDKMLWKRCFASILETLNDLIFAEPIEKVLTHAERRIYDLGTNPRYWASLSKEMKYYNKTKFNNIIEVNGKYKIKTKLNQLFAEQLNEMLTEPGNKLQTAK